MRYKARGELSNSASTSKAWRPDLRSLRCEDAELANALSKQVLAVSDLTIHELKTTTSEASERASSHWSWAQWFALIGAGILFVEIWTLAAWFSDRPHQVNQFATTGSVNWYACTIYESVVLVVAIGVGFNVVRGCVREGRLTFDAMFVLSGMLMFWADANPNFFAPVLLYSSNFVNVNSPQGHMPFAINPAIGSMPDPILITIPLESCGLLAAAMGIGAVAGWLRRRHPAISTQKLIGLLVLGGAVVEILVELPMVAFGLWTYTTPAAISIPLGGGRRLSLIEIVAGTSFFLLPALVRLFKNDRGETLVERGLQGKRPAARAALLFLAMYSFTELLAWGPALVPDLLSSLYERPWPHLANYLVNDTCDAPGITGTTYGLCPGSPGYRMPIRSSKAR
jgi:hypothetical protein